MVVIIGVDPMKYIWPIGILIIVAAVVFVFGQGHFVGSITDPLRILANEAAQVDFVIRIAVFIFSVAVAIIAGVAWTRTQNKKVGLIAWAFGLLAFKWFLKVMDLFVSTGQFFPDHAENVIELVSLVLIAYALFGGRSSTFSEK